MKKSRFTNEQIAFALKQAETGTPSAASASALACTGGITSADGSFPNLLAVGSLADYSSVSKNLHHFHYRRSRCANSLMSTPVLASRMTTWR